MGHARHIRSRRRAFASYPPIALPPGSSCSPVASGIIAPKCNTQRKVWVPLRALKLQRFYRKRSRTGKQPRPASNRHPGLEPGSIPDRLRTPRPFETGLDRPRPPREPEMGPGSSPGRRCLSVLVPSRHGRLPPPIPSHARRQGPAYPFSTVRRSISSSTSRSMSSCSSSWSARQPSGEWAVEAKEAAISR